MNVFIFINDEKIVFLIHEKSIFILLEISNNLKILPIKCLRMIDTNLLWYFLCYNISFGFVVCTVCTPKAEAMTEVAGTMMKERRLLRCLACRALCVIPINSQWLRPGGHLYENAKKHFDTLKTQFPYSFPSYVSNMNGC